MKARTSFLKRCLALALALMMLVSGTNMGIVMQAFAAGDKISVSYGKIVAENYVRENYMEADNIEITVADISTVDPSLDSFLPGQWVNVSSKHHFPSNPNMFLVKKISIGISNPAQTKIFIGRLKRGLSEAFAALQ